MSAWHLLYIIPVSACFGFLAAALCRASKRGSQTYSSPKMQAMADALDACRADCHALEEQLKTERRSKAQVIAENERLLNKLQWQNTLGREL